MSEELFVVSHEKDLDEEVEKLFVYWRDRGFPNYDISNYDKKNELSKLKKYNESDILVDGKDLKQTMHALGFLWTYFPHWIDVKYEDYDSLRENWNDDKKLKELIKKTYKWQLKHGRGKFTINRLRQNAKVYCSKVSVSNFRPTVAKFLYNEFGNKGTVWDMSSGWGGRLFGFLSSDCKKYIGTDPSTKTHAGLEKLRDDFTYVGKQVELNCIGSEDYKPEPKSLDLCFTSPPYFSTEQYAEEDTQSFKKFPTKDKWVDGFLRNTIKNCHTGLKDNGHMIINIANTSKHKTLEQDTVRVAEEEGFYLVDTYRLILSSISGKGNKYEPVFIFKKLGEK
jgi:hypothetical protein